MATGQFITMPCTDKVRLVNINNIALLEDVPAGCKVVLNVTEKGENISFIAQLPWANLSADVIYQDSTQ